MVVVIHGGDGMWHLWYMMVVVVHGDGMWCLCKHFTI